MHARNKFECREQVQWLIFTERNLHDDFGAHLCLSISACYKRKRKALMLYAQEQIDTGLEERCRTLARLVQLLQAV